MQTYVVVELEQGKVRPVARGLAQPERFPSADPEAVMKRLLDEGAGGFYIVDVDAARGVATNLILMMKLLEKFDQVPCFAGGGIRETKIVDKIIQSGADKIVCCTSAVEDLGFLANMSDTYSKNWVMSLDINGNDVYTFGRTKKSHRTVGGQVGALDDIEMGGIVLSFITPDGQDDFVDAARMLWLESSASIDFHARGKIRDKEHAKKIAAASTQLIFLNEEIYNGKATADGEYSD
jgi:phosphoribosylformimino-5-aminoimidazole carboxamide ribonucleotide (ProFAR) isomerase